MYNLHKDAKEEEMKFCPNCKSEYEDVATECIDCGVALVNELPEEIIPDLDICDNCGKEAPLDMDFCPRCGTLYAEDQYSCTNHPLASAKGVCIICEQLYCEECLTQRGKKYLCEAHRNVEVREDWALIFKSSDFYEAQIIRGKLESAGITTNPLNTTNPGFIADGMIESAIGRSLLRYPIKIFVPLDQFLEAEEILSDSEPGDDARI